MKGVLSFVQLFAVCGFAGGCLCLSVTLGELSSVAPEDSARIMRLLLPRMGRVMAPLLVISLALSSYSAVLALWRPAPGALASPLLVVGALLAATLVTAIVHLPLNAEYLAERAPSAQRAAQMLPRWLGWHHLRTGLALLAMGALLWPLRASPSSSGLAAP